MPLFISAYCLCLLSPRENVVLERHFKAAARSLTTFAVLMDDYACHLGEGGLGQAA